VDDELCICGSSRSFSRCHGLGGSERRRRARELLALGELHDLALLFPLPPPEVDPLWEIVGMVKGGSPNDSWRIDEVVYDPRSLIFLLRLEKDARPLRLRPPPDADPRPAPSLHRVRPVPAAVA
jgi:hypothetical protein